MKAINYREWQDLDASQQVDAVQFYMDYYVKIAAIAPEYFYIHDQALLDQLKIIHWQAQHSDTVDTATLIVDDDDCCMKLYDISTKKAMASLYETEFMKYDIVSHDQMMEVQ